jgi:DNA-binding transcriptional LysR family regulator
MTRWNVDIRSARHIVTLARHLSFTSAAEELGITQSALSRSIQRFEASINLRVFDRNRGGVHLTVVGDEIVKRAVALVREADQFERALHHPAEGLQNSVTLGMGHLPARALLPQVMAEELTDNPALRVKVLVRSSETLLSLLLLDEIEFLICADQLVPEEAPVKRSQIGTFPAAQLVRPGHPLLDEGQRRQPHEFPWIITKQFGRNTPAEKNGLSHLREMAQLEIEDFDCLSSITQNSDAIWVTAQAAATVELQSGSLCHLPVPQSPPGHSIKMMMYSRSDRSLSPAAIRLRDKFRIAAKAI